MRGERKTRVVFCNEARNVAKYAYSFGLTQIGELDQTKWTEQLQTTIQSLYVACTLFTPLLSWVFSTSKSTLGQCINIYGVPAI